MNDADVAIVYFNPHTIAHKKLPPISTEQIKLSFGRDDILIYNDSGKLFSDLQKMEWEYTNLLLMSSGNFDGIDFSELAHQVIAK